MEFPRNKIIIPPKGLSSPCITHNAQSTTFRQCRCYIRTSSQMINEPFQKRSACYDVLFIPHIESSINIDWNFES
jgi:hypothetical protein